MKSRYDYMRESKVIDIDGNQYPDPLTIDYHHAIENYNSYPNSYSLTKSNLKRLWVKYYEETGLTEYDDILYTLNGIAHVGLLEPGDQIYKFDPSLVQQFTFTDLTDPE